jgi:large subunit ribosomal protein L4
MALAAKVRDEELVVIDDLAFAEPKTKEMVSVIKHCGCDGGSLLVTTAGYDSNVYRSARNLTGVAVAPASEINAYSVLRSKRVLVTKAALDALVASAKSVGGEANAADGADGAAKPARTKRVTTKSAAPRKASPKKAAE